jgi:hypothetical protein
VTALVAIGAVMVWGLGAGLLLGTLLGTLVGACHAIGRRI